MNALLAHESMSVQPSATPTSDDIARRDALARAELLLQSAVEGLAVLDRALAAQEDEVVSVHELAEELIVRVCDRDVQIEEVRGYGRQKEHLTFYERVGDWHGSFLPKVRLEFTVGGESWRDAVAALREGALTGRIGDGKIFVHTAWPARAPGAPRPEAAP